MQIKSAALLAIATTLIAGRVVAQNSSHHAAKPNHTKHVHTKPKNDLDMASRQTNHYNNGLSKNVNHETKRESKDFNHSLNSASKSINHTFQGKKHKKQTGK